MKNIFFIVAFSAFIFSCADKKKKTGDDETFIPVHSFLRGQIAKMDSSMATIIKVEKTGNRADTTYIRREDFKQHANEFLNLPDISSDKLKEDYTATNLYDDLLNAFVFTYTTEENHPVKKQDVIVSPAADGENKIQALNIDYWVKKADSTIHKNMLWETDKRFLIITKIQKASQPESIKTTEVKWTNTPRGF